MIGKILNKISFKENKSRYLNLKGIFSRRFAYKGPDIVQIDLTDRCNSHCLICWLHSPFIRKDTDTEDLDFTVLKNFMNDIAIAGTKEIIFSGGGEPFLYSKIWEILEFTRKLGLIFRINTNFTLLNRADINRLLSFHNLASLTISIWSEDPIIYSKIHNRNVEYFYKITDNLKFLNSLKSTRLHVRIYTIMSNINYCELRNLIRLSIETGCDAVEFGVPDVIPGITDSFLLSKEQLKSLKHEYINLSGKLKIKSYFFNKELFIRRISNPNAAYGEYDTLVERIPCYTGWLFLRLRANGDLNSCLKSHRIPIGNLYRENFSSAWNGLLQQRFREKGLSISKDKEYFKVIGNSFDEDIGCKRACDNILTNEHLYKIIKYLP